MIKYVLWLALLAAPLVYAQAILRPTRVTPYDWRCEDAEGNKLGNDYQRLDGAIVDCINNPKGAFIQGGRYKINRPAAPAPAPTPTPAPASPPGTATLSWTPPSTFTDGTALTGLAGYRIHYGASPAALANVIQASSPAISSYVVNNLQPGTWYFALQAYTADGAVSAMSDIKSKTVQ